MSGGYAAIPESALPATTRRRFLTGGALIMGFMFSRAARAFDSEPNLAAAGALDAQGRGFAGFVPSGFIRIGDDGRIILVMPSVEMGQGIYTAEAMLIAEELEIGLDQAEVVASPPDSMAYIQSILKSQVTGGSTSIRAFWTPLRQAGAAARSMLVDAAAAQWGVRPEECAADRAVVSHAASGRSLPYAALAAAAARRPVPQNIGVKPVSQFKLIGRPLKRVDTPAKVNGSARFGIDVAIPGLRTAALLMCPTIGGRLRALDDSVTRQAPGVIDVLRLEDAVAVVGEHYWAAKKGVDLLKAEWVHGPGAHLSSPTLENMLLHADAEPTPGVLTGSPEQVMARAPHRLEAIYDLPYLAHATLEPINTTVHVRPDGCDIWVGTQVPLTARKVAAEITGLPPETIMVRNHLIGGGFGRRLAVDTIEQAVRFARQVDYPLKIIWSREQDIQHDHFRPAYHDRIAAGLGPDGLPVAWTHRTTCSTVRPYYDRKPWPLGTLDKDAIAGASELPYAIPAMRVDWVRQDGPVALNWWRGVGETHNVFVVESFVDELARSVDRDPVEYRRAMLAHNPRSRAVLDHAAKAAGWGDPLPPRTGRGISLHDSFGSYAALVVEVSVDPHGEVRLRRAVAAVDCGIAINPDSVAAQIQGGVIFGLSAALFNGITFADGRVEQSNFHDYRQLRFNEAPAVEVHVMPSEENPGGLGEVGTVSAAPALCNAIFAATGVRVRRLPIDRTELAEKGSDNMVAGIATAATIGVGTLVAGATLHSRAKESDR